MAAVIGTFPANQRMARGDVKRRRLVALVFVIYGLLIFEGAIRKWILPEAGQVLFFIRVPFTLLLYWLAFYYRRWPRTTPPLFFAYVIMFAAALLVPLQLFLGGYSMRHVILAGYGWMLYFFYIPLAFLIAEQFQQQDMERLVRITLWLAIAAAPLVVLQFASPPDSIINQGSSLDEETQFRNLGAALGRVRPTGFFTATNGHGMFVTSVAVFVVVLLSQAARSQGAPRWLLWGAVAGVVTMLGVSGSRGMFASVAVILAATAFAGVLANRQRIAIRAGLWPFVLVAGVAVLWPILLPEGFEVFMARWTGAWESETQRAGFEFGMFGRVMWYFYAFFYHLPDTPVQGYLLGIGGNAAKLLDWVQLPPAYYAWLGYGGWAEDAWSRHIVDLGLVLGVLTILGRVALTIWLGLRAAQATRRTGDILPFVLFGFLFFRILYDQIQGHGTLNGYAWLFFGFCLAAVKSAERRHSENSGSRRSSGHIRRT
jgi:hypothetical protein